MNAPGKAVGGGGGQPRENPLARGMGTLERQAYRLITGADDAEFCRRVSTALENGYELYGSPSITFNGQHVVAAQAVVLPDAPRQR